MAEPANEYHARAGPYSAQLSRNTRIVLDDKLSARNDVATYAPPRCAAEPIFLTCLVLATTTSYRSGR